MFRFLLSLLGGVFSFLTLGLAFAAVTLGGVIWVYRQDLPSHETLAGYRPAMISRIYSAEGRVIDEFARERRLFTPIDEIPDLVKQAFISAEDKNFYHHRGYDPRGIASALWDAARSRGRNLRGASTITQQVMKNFLLSGDRRIERKIKEIILAARVERSLSKDRILELYLNEIFLGQNAYGVTAAALTYFNKPLSELAPHEAAFLAALPKAPSDFHPVRNKARLRARRNYVLREMFQNGYISREVYEREIAQPVRSVQNGDFPSFRQKLPPRDYFTDEIRRQLSRDLGEAEFFTGGYAVRATIDPEMQKIAAEALRRQLERYDRSRKIWRGTGKRIEPAALRSEEQWRAALAAMDLPRDIELDGKWLPAVVLAVGDRQMRVGIEGVEASPEAPPVIPRKDIAWMKGSFHDNFRPGDVVYVSRVVDKDTGDFRGWTLRQIPQVQGAFMAMDVHTGRVIAMQGGFSYQASVFNRATQARRQPGSAFKPFVYAAALDAGYTPATIIVDAPLAIETPQGVWEPKNSSNKFYGPTPLRTGIEQSRNLMTVRLAREVGLDVIGAYAEQFGVYDRFQPVLANALGAQETTLFRIVSAYAMFANGGERVEPTLVDRVQDRWGRTVYRHDERECLDCGADTLPPGRAPQIVSHRARVIDPVTAYQITSMMQGVVQRGTAAGVIDLPVPVAGKTGTTNDSRDVWFVGFTPRLVAGCYIGYDNPRSLGRRAYGSTLCGPVFQDFMSRAIRKYGGGEFKVPEACEFIKIDRFTGSRLPDDATGANVVSECFRADESPVFGVVYDGGFGLGSNFEIIAPEGQVSSREVTTSGGRKAVVGPKATLGTMSSGGLY